MHIRYNSTRWKDDNCIINCVEDNQKGFQEFRKIDCVSRRHGDIVMLDLLPIKFAQPKSNVCKHSSSQDDAQNRRAVFIIIKTFRMAFPQIERPVDEDDAGVGDGEERCDGEKRGSDEACLVVRGDEVEERGGDRADEDGELEPFLREKRVKEDWC